MRPRMRTARWMRPVCLLAGLVFFSSCGPMEESELIDQPQQPENEPGLAEEDYLDPDLVANEESLTVTALRLKTYVRTTTQLNLRSAPSRSSTILESMPAGAKVF